MANMANDYAILDAAEFNPVSDYIYTKPSVNKQGGKSIGILNSTSKKGLYIKTPLMRCWGINENDFEGKGNVKYDMSLQFPDKEYSTPEKDKFLKNMLEFEEKIKADAIKNCKEWMNKTKMSPEVLEALWTPIVKYPKTDGEPDHSKNPTLNIKIPVWDGEWKIELYDVDGETLFPSDKGVTAQELVPKPTDIATVIQCGGIWFANGKFGVTWKLVQAVVKPKQSLRGKCFINLSDDDKAALNKANDQSDDEEDTAGNVEVADSSSDEEEAPVTPAKEVAVSIADAVPPGAPKKKVVRKKKVAE